MKSLGDFTKFTASQKITSATSERPMRSTMRAPRIFSRAATICRPDLNRSAAGEQCSPAAYFRGPGARAHEHLLPERRVDRRLSRRDHVRRLELALALVDGDGHDGPARLLRI